MIELELNTSQGNNGETVEDLEDQLQALYDNARYIINLHGKILVFLEPPHPEIWNILKPILSHDHWEIEHPHVDTDLKTKNVVTRGWPVCFFCSAKDESKWDIWPEIQSRFIIISPNMSKEKYEEANVLTLQKLGLPDFVQDKVIVSSQEIENSQKCILLLRRRTKELCVLPENNTDLGLQSKPKNPVWIPYQEYLGSSLPSNRGVEMRGAKYVASLLGVVAISKSNFLLDAGEGRNTDVIARPEDLIETLRLILDLVNSEYSGIPVQKIKFLEEIFYPLYDGKTKPDESRDGSKQESIRALMTKELCDRFKQVRGRGITPDNLKKQFLEELVANDLIGETESEIDKRRHIFYPLIDPTLRQEQHEESHQKITKLSNRPSFDNFSYTPILQLSRDYKYLPENWLILQILGLV